MEPIEVSARFDSKGSVFPLNFVWRNQSYIVISTGRRWVEEDKVHILVMVPSQRVFELVFDSLKATWFLKQVGLVRHSA